MKSLYITKNKSQFEKSMNIVSGIVLIFGLLFFLSIVLRLVFEQFNCYPFCAIVNFIQTHSINFPAIWADISIWLCIWLISFSLVVILAANNYRRSIREDYLVRTTSKLIALHNEIDELKSANKILRESKAKLFDRTPAARSRNLKGQFLPKA
jgi:hypothetical protein